MTLKTKNRYKKCFVQLETYSIQSTVQFKYYIINLIIDLPT